MVSLEGGPMARQCLGTPLLQSFCGTCFSCTAPDSTVILNCCMYCASSCDGHVCFICSLRKTLCALNCAMHKTRIFEHYLEPTVIFHTLLHLYFCYVFVDIIVYFLCKNLLSKDSVYIRCDKTPKFYPNCICKILIANCSHYNI
jgi:hypothetical protein